MRRGGGGGKGDLGGGWCFYMRKKSCLGGWEKDECDNSRVEARKSSKAESESHDFIHHVLCVVHLIR